ncbi:MAG: RluA family pseudouridine synthase [Candidatus Omnitrophica bacterium]|nr:RluA family pseudouridine synthase [Candidatus Omnitrophota bacterium]
MREELPLNNSPSRKQIPILYEDEQVVIFNKPSGMLVIPAPNENYKTLVDIVNKCYRQDDAACLHPCHRLDRDTSGAIIFAKGKVNQQLVMNMFARKLISKRYLAFVQGWLKSPKGDIRLPVQSLDRKKFRKHSKPVHAITKYKVLEKRKNFSIIEVEPVTGRSNQIRIHFSLIGNPLVGDRKYSFARDYSLKFKRTALHSLEVNFKNPVTGKIIEVRCELPKDMEDFLERN